MGDDVQLVTDLSHEVDHVVETEAIDLTSTDLSSKKQVNALDTVNYAIYTLFLQMNFHIQT